VINQPKNVAEKSRKKSFQGEGPKEEVVSATGAPKGGARIPFGGTNGRGQKNAQGNLDKKKCCGRGGKKGKNLQKRSGAEREFTSKGWKPKGQKVGGEPGGDSGEGDVCKFYGTKKNSQT